MLDKFYSFFDQKKKDWKIYDFSNTILGFIIVLIFVEVFLFYFTIEQIYNVILFIQGNYHPFVPVGSEPPTFDYLIGMVFVGIFLLVIIPIGINGLLAIFRDKPEFYLKYDQAVIIEELFNKPDELTEDQISLKVKLHEYCEKFNY